MYMAYGYPQVIPLEQGQYPTSQNIIYLKLINRLLLVVSPLHLELWSSSQHNVRLGRFKRDADSLQRDGENLQAVWSPDTKLIAVLTLSFFLHIFKVQFTERKVQLGGKQPSGLFLAMITRVLNEQFPFAENDLIVSNILSDKKHMLLGLSDGSLYSISWKGEFYGVFGLDSSQHNDSEGATVSHSLVNFTLSEEDDRTFASNNNVSKKSAIAQLEFCVSMRLLLVLYSDGQLVSCSVSKKGLKAVESIKAEKKMGNGDAVCNSAAGDQLILAVGTRRGVVELYDLADSGSLIRTVSLI